MNENKSFSLRHKDFGELPGYPFGAWVCRHTQP